MLPEESPASRLQARPEVTDRDRDRTIAMLRLHCTEGRLSLDDFADRVGSVYAAERADELDALVSDLAVPWRDDADLRRDADAELRPRRAVRWLVAVFGSSARRGRYRLDEESAAVAVFGDCVLDLSQATIDDPSPAVNAIALFGEVTVIVPDGIEVEMDGLAIFGEKRCDTSSAEFVDGSPVIRVRVLAIFGEVRVRPAEERDRRASKRLRRR